MSLKINSTFETEVYTTEGGYVAIKQIDTMGNDDQLVLLSAEQLKVIISELQTLLRTREEWEDLMIRREEETGDSAAVS